MTTHDTDSEFVEHVPCPHCGSSDAGSLYSDGHCHCFSCEKTWTPDGAGTPSKGKRSSKKKPEDGALQTLIETATIRALPKRSLTLATCQKFNYRTRINSRGEGEHFAIYCNENGQPIDIKIRNVGKSGSDKSFTWALGEKTGLFGRHLWRSSGGKMLVVTAGEIDAMSVSQSFGNKFPVVSIPNGCAQAAKAIAKELEWVNTFERVVFMFDMEPPEELEKAIDCARMLPPGKAFIAHLSMKDPNALLMAGKAEEITSAAWNARQYRPDGIVSAKDLIGAALGKPAWGIPWPWQFMTNWTYGRRDGEVYTFGAGTGVGKSDALAQIIASTVAGKTLYGETYKPEAAAVFNYEAGAVVTLKSIVGKLMNRRFHIPDEDRVFWTEDELREGMRRIVEDCAPLFINDHFGRVDWDSVKERCRYLAKAENVKHFVIDPITALAIGEDDERKKLDQIMLEASTLSVELSAKFYLVSHLTRPSFGPPHEEGGRVMLSQFRGSNGIGMFSSFVFGFERDQQSTAEEEQAATLVRDLKDRYTGNSTGCTHPVYYNRISGALEELLLEDPTIDGNSVGA